MGSRLDLDGFQAPALAERWGLPSVMLVDQISSTMDIAHEAAAIGAHAGTLVVAQEQMTGRGRSGGRWLASRGAAVLATIVERPAATPALEVLSVRIGLGLAMVLDRHAATPLRVKWPNDVYDATGKVAGILIETRWRDQRPEWVAIGIGINVLAAPPASALRASALAEGTRRIDVLDAVIPAIRGAAARRDLLQHDEIEQWNARDLLRGVSITTPHGGTVAGIAPSGDLLVDTPAGRVACRAGTVTLKEA